MSTHTPGPWGVDDGDSNTLGVFAVNDGGAIAYLSEEPRRGVGGLRSPAEDWANAHLIACAPELYTVLDAFLSDYEERGEVDYKLRERAQAVLDKAVGR